jgi:hypothetical protein
MSSPRIAKPVQRVSKGGLFAGVGAAPVVYCEGGTRLKGSNGWGVAVLTAEEHTAPEMQEMQEIVSAPL